MTAKFDMLKYVLDELYRTKDSREKIAAGSGVSFSTINKIASRETMDPRISSVQALYDYFRAQKNG